MLNRKLEIRKHLREVPNQDHYHLIKALDLMLDEIERLSNEEQRLTNKVIELQFNINRLTASS